MKLHSKIKDYTEEMLDNIFDRKTEVLKDIKYDRIFYFIDENVYNIYKDKLEKLVDKDFMLLITASETSKEYLNLANYYSALIENNFTRNDILITIGGGILQDISGFIASTLYRGIKWIFIPTTLLSQADSCIGSKTSINFNNGKNLIGSFYPPDRIYIDPSLCKTLKHKYFNSGLGEIIKFHLMSDEKRYHLLHKYLNSPNLKEGKLYKKIISSTLEIKKSYFEGDEFDTGRRNLLNYGHCFGHALESASNFEICHGEAVLVGMGFANLLSLNRGLITEEKYEEFENLLKKYYPRFNLSKIKVENLIFYLKKDKKRVGKDLTMILSKDVGKQFKYNDIKESEVIETYNEFLKIYPFE